MTVITYYENLAQCRKCLRLVEAPCPDALLEAKEAHIYGSAHHQLDLLVIALSPKSFTKEEVVSAFFPEASSHAVP